MFDLTKLANMSITDKANALRDFYSSRPRRFDVIKNRVPNNGRESSGVEMCDWQILAARKIFAKAMSCVGKWVGL